MPNSPHANLAPHLKCPQRPLTTGSWRSMRPQVQVEKCNLCGLCDVLCPDGVIKLTAAGLTIDWDYCKGCGICATECYRQAMVMVEEVANV
ncbi:MAG: 4Fe-4S binding protein [Peptococcaceae bacterium]|nr:4Fe-4S binding protein [Peptococcaceae bacterium]